MPGDQTIVPDEFAQLLRISRANFYRLKSRGRIPRPVQLGRLCRWPLAEVLAWLRAGGPPRDEWDDMRGDLGF